jgi:hypothetical protein
VWGHAKAWHLIAARIHTLGISAIIVALNLRDRAIGVARANGRSGNRTDGSAWCRPSPTAASGGDRAKGRARQGPNERAFGGFIIRPLGRSGAAALTIGILAAGGVICHEHFKRLIWRRHDRHRRPDRTRGATGHKAQGCKGDADSPGEFAAVH